MALRSLLPHAPRLPQPQSAASAGIRHPLAAALAALLLPAAAAAATDSAPLDIRVTVVDRCVIDSVTALEFPRYMSGSAQDVNGEALLVVDCNTGTAVEIALDSGGNASGATRRMRSGDDFIAYNLYTDASYGTVWGDESFGGGPLVTTTTTSPATFAIRGRIPAAQTAPAGDYSDQVTITLVVQ